MRLHSILNQNDYKKWTTFEFVFLFISVVLPPVLGFMFHAGVFQILATLFSLIAVFLCCKTRDAGEIASFVAVAMLITATMLIADPFVMASVFPALGMWGILMIARLSYQSSKKKEFIIKYSFIGFLACDALFLSMWAVYLSTGVTECMVMFVAPVMMIAADTYSFFTQARRKL